MGGFGRGFGAGFAPAFAQRSEQSVQLQQKRREQLQKLRQANDNMLAQLGGEVAKIRGIRGPEAAEAAIQKLSPALNRMAQVQGVPVDELMDRVRVFGQTAATAKEEGARTGAVAQAAASGQSEAFKTQTPAVVDRARQTARVQAEEKAKGEKAGGRFGGTGITAQTFNELLDFNNKIRTKQPITPEDIDAYALAVQNFTTPRIITLPDGRQAEVTPKLPSNFIAPQDLAGNERKPAVLEFDETGKPVQQTQPSGQGTATQTIRPIGEKKPRTPEQAAKSAAVIEAENTLKSVRSAIITQTDAKGNVEIDRGLIATMNANVPFTEGRKVRAQFNDVIEAKIRAESGAAVPPQEIERALDRFLPSPLDNDATVVDKLDRLQNFLNTSIKEFDPAMAKRLGIK